MKKENLTLYFVAPLIGGLIALSYGQISHNYSLLDGCSKVLSTYMIITIANFFACLLTQKEKK